VWRKFITVNRPTEGTMLDLRGMYDAGAMTVDTNMTATSTRAPETGVQGAFDGSTTPASSAVRPAGGRGESTYTIKLDREYTLTDVGLSLHPGRLASARVEASTDGQTWTPVTFTGGGFNLIRSRCLDYRTVAGSGISAAQLRFTVEDPSGPAILNEVELFTTPR
jgi:hypothetical protein